MNKKKRKGGAARLRDTNKKLLLTAGSQCHNLLNMFSTLTEKQKPNNFSILVVYQMYIVSKILHNNFFINYFNIHTFFQALYHNIAVNETQNGQINNDITGRDFGSASTNMSREFFDFHPHQPHLTHPFKSSKVFLGKNNIQRRWITYDEHSEKLFCSVCLAFSSERNIFIDGFNTWSHVYQRVQEHEIIKSHNLVIDVIKLIGKRGLSYRGHRNEGADSLNDSTLDHVEIRDAVMFSVHLDTTQDISIQDQCSNILRYVNYKDIQERLLAVITVQQSTGRSFSDMLQGVLADNGLDVMKCIGNATDEAANMQGQFNGFSAWLEKSTPNQVHVWCYSHILNLVIIDSTKSPLKAAALFVTLNDLENYFKELYKRMNVWVNFVGENNKKRLQSISNTRWWSKEVALKHIFGSDGMYIDVILAKTLKNSILDYSTILTPFIYIRIFNIGMDLLKCQEMVCAAIKDLKLIQRDMSGVKVMAKRFIDTMSEKLECIETENIDIVIETEASSNPSTSQQAQCTTTSSDHFRSGQPA
ncbi:hypothetical protein QTP88_021629 [Uroleucon formosanum]